MKTKIKQGILALALPIGLIGCIEKDQVQVIPDAENILFTSDDRLLVTGGDNIYEITGNAQSGFSKKALFNGKDDVKKYGCNFTGIAQSGDWVFTSCVSTKFLIFTNNHLLAANLNDANLEFKMLNNPGDRNDPYDVLALPNGLAFAPDGALLVADYNLFAKSGVARIDFDLNGALPSIAGLQKNFVSPQIHNISSPNGIRVDGDYLYMSDANSVKRFQFDANAQIPEKIDNEFGEQVTNSATIWKSSLAIVDDIMPYCDGVAFTSYLSGRLHYAASYVDQNNEEHFPVLYSTPPLAFDSPSALAIGQVPGFFESDQLLVTEKGLLGDLNSTLGNQLSVSPLTLDLADPNMCNIVQDLAREAIEGS